MKQNEQLVRDLERVLETVKSGWCKGFSAVTATRDEVTTFSKKAQYRCLAGAAELVAGRGLSSIKRFNAIEFAIASELDSPSGWWLEDVITFNDSKETTKADVIRVVKAALKKAKAAVAA